MFLKLVVLVALVGIIVESKVIHRRDADSDAVDAAIDAVKKETKELENLKTTSKEQAHAVASAILKAIENLKQKASKTAKSAQKNKRASDGDENKISCCG